MRGIRWAALGAAAALAAAPAAGAERSCTLARVDRARTSSAACIACHDGTAGAAIPFVARAGGLGPSHPVQIDYAAAAARQPGRYAAASELPPDVPLVEGRIECTTCHDGASAAPAHAARAIGLCLACHRI